MLTKFIVHQSNFINIYESHQDLLLGQDRRLSRHLRAIIVEVLHSRCTYHTILKSAICKFNLSLFRPTQARALIDPLINVNQLMRPMKTERSKRIERQRENESINDHFTSQGMYKLAIFQLESKDPKEAVARKIEKEVLPHWEIY